MAAEAAAEVILGLVDASKGLRQAGGACSWAGCSEAEEVGLGAASTALGLLQKAGSDPAETLTAAGVIGGGGALTGGFLRLGQSSVLGLTGSTLAFGHKFVPGATPVLDLTGGLGLKYESVLDLKLCEDAPPVCH